jgi:general secretion pathway protein G
MPYCHIDVGFTCETLCNIAPKEEDPQEARIAMAPRTQGFTLLELLVVVVIIGLLAGFVAPRYFGQVGKSEVNVAKAQLDALEKALDQYRLDTGRYPSPELGLKALLERPANEPKWNGPYLRKAIPLDPWGKPYLYRIPGEKAEFDLLSYGKDGQPGGSGENADITNH